jgi:dihydroorotate dehydrogenase subfamily 2
VAQAITLAGLQFPNRVGLAAGLDKNARCIDGLGAMGFGFVEVGTVTPKAQPGNPKPRMFRLPEAQALINRLGFNNDGLDAFIANVKRSKFRQQGRLLGLNIGKNAATPMENATDDYVIALAGVYPHADYVTVNISSPNTKNLRALQSDEALDGLLGVKRADTVWQQIERDLSAATRAVPPSTSRTVSGTPRSASVQPTGLPLTSVSIRRRSSHQSSTRCLCRARVWTARPPRRSWWTKA